MTRSKITHGGWIVFGLLLTAVGIAAQSKDLGNGFRDHGVAVPISNQRGAAAAVDGRGRNVLLVLLMDHRGGYSLLMLEVATGKAEQFPVPFPPPGESVDSPYASILSSGNKFYTHFKSHLMEFDPVKRAFTFSAQTTPWFAMGMTEDDAGNIWTVTYPQCGVLRFNPTTRELRDYGEVHKETWPQYPSYVAADDAGWVYFGIGHTSSQIVALDPASGTATPILAESKRKRGAAYVYRDLDGRVYGQALKGDQEDWLELHKGVWRKIGKRVEARPKVYLTGTRASQSVFSDGTKVNCDLVRRRLTVEDPRAGEKKEFNFNYESDGAIIMGEAAAPDGTICGGTAFPMHFFRLSPKTGGILNRPGFGQWNIVRTAGKMFYVGAYGGGHLLEWDPSRPWVDTDPRKPGEGNPAHLGTAEPEIHRPSQLLATKDGRTIIMSGTPAYGATGGGLLFWDKAKRAATVLKDQDVVPDQSTLSMINLPDGQMLAGTTTSPGTGGEKKAAEAVLYIMDLAGRRIEWQAAGLPGVQEYTDLTAGPDGKIYGIADRTIFFVFDPVERAIVARQDVGGELGRAAYHQGPRVFVAGPKGAVYALFSKGIAKVDPQSNILKLVAASPLPVDTGGDYLKGRIYFSSGSHLLSWKVN